MKALKSQTLFVSAIIFLALIIFGMNNQSVYAESNDIDEVFLEIYNESKGNKEIKVIRDDYDSYSFILQNKNIFIQNNGFLKIVDASYLKENFKLDKKSIQKLSDFIERTNKLVELEAITINENLQIDTVDEPEIKKDNQIIPRATVFSILSDARSNSKTLKSVYDNATFSTKHYIAGKYFATRVKTGGIWDYKVFLGPKTLYYDNILGSRMTGEAMGNFHYGYVGRTVFSPTTLKTTAGAYQFYSGTSEWKYWESYFDDPNDTKEIQKGIDRYEIEH